MEEAVGMEFEAIEEDLGEIQWEDGIFKASEYIERLCIGIQS